MTASTPTPSGIAAFDAQWGGLRPGSAALLVGRAGAGRTTLALRAVQAAIDAGQTCLFLSPRTPEALQAAAREAGLDLAALHKTGKMRVLRIPSAKDLAAKGNAGLDAAYRDLGGLASSAGAQRIVIEDFTPLVQYGTFEAFSDAFDGLRSAFAEVGASFLLGLGEPANAASQQLLDVVQARVDATVRVSPGSPDPTVTVETAAPLATPASGEPPEVSPETMPTLDAAPEPTVAREPEPAPAPSPEAFEPPAEPSPEPFEAAPRAPIPPDPFADVPAMPSAPQVPIDVVHPPEEIFPSPPSNDGASLPHQAPLGAAFPVDTDPSAQAPEPLAPDPFAEPASQEFVPQEPATPEAATPEGAPAPPVSEAFAADPSPPEASGDSAPPQTFDPFGADSPAPPSGILRADVEPAPSPDPELLAPKADLFARDPGHSFFEGGYLVDSRGAKTIPVTSATPEAFGEAPLPAPPAPEAPEPAASIEPVPSFAPLGAPAAPPDDSGAAATRAALEAAFASRASGAPFLVVAARMEPSQPEAAHFATVIEGLRAALPPGASLYADTSRLRSLLVVPGASAGSASQVFSTLQQHLNTRLGVRAEATLQAVAAITVPDGQPFGSAQELWAYAVES